MAEISRDITLKHRANLGEQAEDVEFRQGEEVTVLKEWEESLLCKNEAGLLFNIPKEHVEE
jgi:hypothetical protein